MAKGISLEITRREGLTKGGMRRIRRQGMVPGAVYGKGLPTIPVILNGEDLTRVFRTRGRGGLFRLNMAGEEPMMALLREVQRTPVTGEIVHVDFQKVKMSEIISVMVPVALTGEEELLKERAIIQMSLKEVEIECLPGNLPDSIVIDITDRAMGDKILVNEIKLPEGVRVLTDPDSVVLVIAYPMTEAEEIESDTESGEGEAPEE